MAHRAPRRLSRRQFGVLGTQVSGAVIAVLLGIPIVGFLISPLFRQHQAVWRKVGDTAGGHAGEPTKFEVAFPQDVWTTAEENLAVYVVKSGDNTRVFSNVCTHMQCPVRWETALHQCRSRCTCGW